MAEEVNVARASDLRDGEMKQVKVGQDDVLLARIDGQFYAISATCPHYGGPLAKGVLHGQRVMCPWHHACFDVTDGRLLEPPALEHLPRYAVRVDGDAVLVTTPAVPAAPWAKPDQPPPPDERVFVVLGAGAAGTAAAEQLRAEGFGGRLIMLTREQQQPYDRTKLSKDYLAGEAPPDKLPIHDDAFYAERKIELWPGREVAEVDVAARTVRLADGERLKYDGLLLASGGAPTSLDVPGADNPNVFVLRSTADADQIAGQAEHARRAVVIGASFIGMEAAASLTARGIEVTVVAPGKVPFERTLGEQIGRMFQALHEEQGVRFRMGQKAERIEGQGKAEQVVLENGERLAADLVVAGIGVKPATDYLRGVERADDDGIPVDRSLQAAPGVFAAGDIAAFPDQRSGEQIRVEHWRLALQHGLTAARAMLGQNATYDGVPFFWTKQYDLSLRYVGHAEDWDETIVWGDLAKREFATFYVKDGQVAAAAGAKRDADLAAVEELLRIGRMPNADALRGGPIDLAGLLRS